MSTKKWLSLLILLLPSVMVVSDVFISNMILGPVQKAFSATHAEIELIIAGYLVGFSVFQIASGRLGDRFGKKKMLILGLIWFSLFSILCAFSINMEQLIVFRFFEGLGAAMMIPQSIAFIQVTFRGPEERSKAFGFFGASVGVASITGILGNSWLLSTDWPIAGWRLSFLITPLIGAIAIALSIGQLEETEKNKQQKFDLTGLSILTIGLLVLIYPIIQGRQLGWPAWTFYSLAGAFGILYGFIGHQRHKQRNGGSALIDMQLFRLGHFKTGLLVVLFAFSAHNSFILVYLLFIRHFAGNVFFLSVFPLIFYGMGFGLSSLLAIRYIPRFGRLVLQFGITIMIFSLIIQMIIVGADKPAYWFYVCLVIYGIGQGMFLPSLLNVTLDGLPRKFSGAAAGIYATFQQFSSSLGVAIIGGIFFTILEHHHSAFPFRHAFDYGITSIIVCLIAAIALLQFIPTPTSLEKMELRKVNRRLGSVTY